MERTPREIAAAVIEAFGGLTKMARALGHRNVSTIDGWQRSEKGIPHWRRPEIISAASRLGVTLPQDFEGRHGDSGQAAQPDERPAVDAAE